MPPALPVAAPYFYLAAMAPTQVLCHPPVVSFSTCQSLDNQRQHYGLMPVPPMFHQTRPSWSLDDLSSELIALIFLHLRDLDANSLAAARLACRRLDAIGTPIKYEYLRLTKRIIAPEAQIYLPYALQKVHAHTRHVEVSSDLDPENIKRLLDRIQFLRSIRADLCSGGFWVPADILSSRHLEQSRTKLFVDDLPLRDFSGEPGDRYLRAIPTDILVSLRMTSSKPPLTTRLDSLKGLLLRSEKLETLHYNDRGQGTRFVFAEGERMPALRELVLRSYDWNHTADEVEKHWDFSRIRRLKLIDVPMFEFLDSVPFMDLAGLESLHCEDFSAHLHHDRRREATQGLYTLVRRIRALQTLTLTCFTQLFPIDALLAHAHTLEVLRFRDHVGFGDEARRCPTLWVDDLAQLGRGLGRLHTLELDMDMAMCDPPLFLRTLGGFGRLHTLVLHVQTAVRVLESLPPGVDPDREAAMKVFDLLLRAKTGAAWRSITINVGGWRRHLVRRLSAAWRLQNENGIYAERCFVLEQNPASSQMVLREEVAIEV